MQDEQQSTSILELLYLTRAKNRGEITFTEWHASALRWAQAVIAEYEGGGNEAIPLAPTLSEAEDAA